MNGIGEDGWPAYGIALRLWRRKAGVSQQDLAQRAGLSPWTLSRLESGEQIPRRATLDALARAIGPDVTVTVAGVPVRLTPAPGADI